MDGDGAPDLLAGSEEGAGVVACYSCASGAMLMRVDGMAPGERLGKTVRFAGDVDLDGVVDVLAGYPETNSGAGAGSGRAVLLSGATHEALWEKRGGHDHSYMGEGLAAMGDVNGDGFPDFAVGAWGHDSRDGVWQTGSVWVSGFHPFLAVKPQSLSVAAGGSLRFDVDFPVELAGKDYQLLLSLAGDGPTPLGGADVPLSPDTVFQRTAAHRYPAGALAPAGVLDAHGDALARIALPAGLRPALAGRTLHAAVVAWEAGQVLETSAARTVELTP